MPTLRCGFVNDGCTTPDEFDFEMTTRRKKQFLDARDKHKEEDAVVSEYCEYWCLFV